MKEFLRRARRVLVVVAIALVVVVVMQNTESVETRILWLKLEMPRAVLLFGTLGPGFGIGILTAWRWKKKAESSNGN